MRVHRSLASGLRFAPALLDSLHEAARTLDCEVAYFMITSTEAGWRTQRVILACDPVWALEYEQRECFRSDSVAAIRLHRVGTYQCCRRAMYQRC
jgi:hypothetical protein